MAKLIFKYEKDDLVTKYNREAGEVELTVPGDMNIWEFKTVVKRLASALGFHKNSIERGFETNNDKYSNSNKDFKSHPLGVDNSDMDLGDVDGLRKLLTEIDIRSSNNNSETSE